MTIDGISVKINEKHRAPTSVILPDSVLNEDQYNDLHMDEYKYDFTLEERALHWVSERRRNFEMSQSQLKLRLEQKSHTISAAGCTNGFLHKDSCQSHVASSSQCLSTSIEVATIESHVSSVTNLCERLTEAQIPSLVSAVSVALCTGRSSVASSSLPCSAATVSSAYTGGLILPLEPVSAVSTQHNTQSVGTRCDVTCHSGGAPELNYRDFESSDPFDTAELSSIDVMEQLASVFQTSTQQQTPSSADHSAALTSHCVSVCSTQPCAPPTTSDEMCANYCSERADALRAFYQRYYGPPAASGTDTTASSVGAGSSTVSAISASLADVSVSHCAALNNVTQTIAGKRDSALSDSQPTPNGSSVSQKINDYLNIPSDIQEVAKMGFSLDRIRHFAFSFPHDPAKLALFCEGTRFTAEKHRTSMQFARQKGLPELKHLLLPRTKGFSHLVPLLRHKFTSIYDLTISHTGQEPTIGNIISGKRLEIHLFLRRHQLADISDEDTTDFVNCLFRDKDQLLERLYSRRDDSVLADGRQVGRSLSSLLITACAQCVSLCLLICSIQISSVCTVIIFLPIFYGVYKIVSFSRIAHCSSYGSTKAL